ncbi:MAG: excinuclease ABC subunit UvrC [Alphaproteobacteria bacterium]|nr:excinuclease ABC subunit UvrC [Alphaproteobacteria bacterium]MBU1515989.1 excinuclease ABC subunit UvrC [Alphaproteobacteria bacterium]MBU2092796.1 excinuclease ABC subunit UvrC [Alphaproteobacteria bacterium]MBU2153679.1 excinuclease ABC subunit UvrC [Alphaproteobacteria bacterium]MBU2308307.1 excinuclease ABC subunit UvrC [Alphaproteobacteria bacterium]
MLEAPPPPSSEAAPLKGAALIKDEVKRLPDRPGVYRMMGEDGEVLYVGKARSLKKRVIQYAQGRFHTQRIAHMVDLTRSMEFVTTRTETDALLLEINLIKQLKPRFNVLLRDDKSFPEIVIRREHPAAQLRKHRGAHTIKGDYFGPFASAHSVTKTLNTLQKAFLLRSCSDSVYESRTRPCMLHQIKRCAAPCTGLIALDDYAGLVDQAEDFLRGKSRKVMQRLSESMQAASDDMEFELAARLRDRIRALASVAQEQQINPETLEEADVFALHAEGGQACVQVFFFRAGQNWGNRAYFPRVDRSDEDLDIMGAFLGQFYDDKPIPKVVLVNILPAEQALLQEAFAQKSGRKVEISRPQRGEKKQLVEHAFNNAREALGRKMAESSAQSKLLAGVCEAFGLETQPERIEVYDNSHIMGTNAVGGMIVAGPEGFQKSQYRKFNIKSTEITPGDDFGMMKEVLRRRFARLVKEEEEGEGAIRPDLVLIDGGAGQIAAVMEVMADLGVDDIPVVGVAKGLDRDAGMERFFIPGKEPFRFDHKSPVLYYLQRLRDEAHRFAIGTHRARRAIDMKKNPLDEIDGIGPGKKRALLHAFGSARGVSRASVDDLAKVEGVSEPLAQRVYDHFRK